MTIKSTHLRILKSFDYPVAETKLQSKAISYEESFMKNHHHHDFFTILKLLLLLLLCVCVCVCVDIWRQLDDRLSSAFSCQQKNANEVCIFLPNLRAFTETFPQIYTVYAYQALCRCLLKYKPLILISKSVHLADDSFQITVQVKAAIRATTPIQLSCAGPRCHLSLKKMTLR